ncbi:hypothetical protein DF011_13870 [Burkholderia ubonensis]|nr:hypothetical protein CJO70_23390 [Burkholderia ubonensis]PAJ92309.1 hypothetical protein CJO69_22905 [Burkholderia ubonensis]PAK05665.1 hypothetical protein CJO67_23070 [Burkholderia ubonensis]RQP67652.1 hypothetical protein DF013_31095 [Burkholderia ubonensis]RQP84812.1 hypothetical protein DF014_13860 [Burkholderia ubonensis]
MTGTAVAQLRDSLNLGLKLLHPAPQHCLADADRMTRLHIAMTLVEQETRAGCLNPGENVRRRLVIKYLSMASILS